MINMPLTSSLVLKPYIKQKYTENDFSKDLNNLKDLKPTDIVYVNEEGHLAHIKLADYNEMKKAQKGKLDKKVVGIEKRVVDAKTLIGFLNNGRDNGWKITTKDINAIGVYIHKQKHDAVDEAALNALGFSPPNSADTPVSKTQQKVKKTVGNQKPLNQPSEPENTSPTTSATSAAPPKVEKESNIKFKKAVMTVINQNRAMSPEVRETRDAIVMPSQIRESLKNYVDESLIKPDMRENIAYGICRLVNGDSNRGKLELGKRYRLQPGEANEAQFNIPKFQGMDYKKKEPVKLPCDCYVELYLDKDDRKCVRVILTAPENSNPNQKIGSGTYKDIFHAIEFNIPLVSSEPAKDSMSNIALRNINPQRVVLAVPRRKDDKGNRISIGKNVEKSAGSHADLKAKLPNTNLPSAPIPLTPPGTHYDDARYIMAQSETDLKNAIQNGKVLVGPANQKHEVRLNTEGLVGILHDVAKDLSEYEKIGIVHRDVKLDNILIGHAEKEGKDRLIGQLSDVDLSTSIGDWGSQNGVVNYGIWDESCKQGCPSSFTDCFSMGLAIFQALNPKFSTFIKNPTNFSRQYIDYTINNALRILIDSPHLKNNAELAKIITGNKELRFENVRKAVDAALKNAKQSERSDLLELKKSLVLCEYAFNLVSKLVEQDKKVDEWMCENVFLLSKGIKIDVNNIKFKNEHLENRVDKKVVGSKIDMHNDIIKLDRDKLIVEEYGDVRYLEPIDLKGCITFISSTPLSPEELQSEEKSFYENYKDWFDGNIKERLTREAIVVRREPILEGMQKATGHITAADIMAGLEKVQEEIRGVQ